MTSAASRQPRPAGTDRLQGLLAAHRSITDDLSLRSVPDRIVRAARDLVGAEQAALEIEGVELLGVVRIDDLRAQPGDPRAREFAARNPAMRAFLGVPIQVRGAEYGQLYLADRAVGRFDADDEDLVVSLAVTAGQAIENAHLYDEARRSRDWINASGEIARALLADADDKVLLDVVSRAFSAAEADYAALILPTDEARMHVSVAKGVGADDFHGYVFDPTTSTMGKAILAAESIRTHDMTLWAKLDYPNPHQFGPAMIVPLVYAEGSRGAVLMMRTAGRVQFTAYDVELASTFAAQVALALELNAARAEAERMRVLEDRHRLAQDLHDNVMQRLFATGVGLQALAGEPMNVTVADRLRRHIADLDDTIDEIRSRVFGLRDDAVDGARSSLP